ncbi:hypothetical protein D3C76_1763780 [compost metagenome]
MVVLDDMPLDQPYVNIGFVLPLLKQKLVQHKAEEGVAFHQVPVFFLQPLIIHFIM